jgi:sugar lactone lactonase YvrE
VWNCEYAGGRVVRYTPSGTIDRVIPVPVDNPTCCAFGSRDLRTLFITSARQRLTPEQLATQPLAGSVLAVRTDVGGLPEHCFGTAM